MYMFMLVLDNPDHLEPVLEVWEQIGVRGATIVESTGIHHLRRKNVPMRYFYQASGLVEEGHVTLFVIVESERLVEDCLHAAEIITGNLNEPNTGVFAAWPLMMVRGVPPRSKEA